MCPASSKFGLSQGRRYDNASCITHFRPSEIVYKDKYWEMIFELAFLKQSVTISIDIRVIIRV